MAKSLSLLMLLFNLVLLIAYTLSPSDMYQEEIEIGTWKITASSGPDGPKHFMERTVTLGSSTRPEKSCHMTGEVLTQDKTAHTNVIYANMVYSGDCDFYIETFKQ